MHLVIHHRSSSSSLWTRMSPWVMSFRFTGCYSTSPGSKSRMGRGKHSFTLPAIWYNRAKRYSFALSLPWSIHIMLGFPHRITHLFLLLLSAIISFSLPLPFIFTQTFPPLEKTSGSAAVPVQISGSKASLGNASPRFTSIHIGDGDPGTEPAGCLDHWATWRPTPSLPDGMKAQSTLPGP